MSTIGTSGAVGRRTPRLGIRTHSKFDGCEAARRAFVARSHVATAMSESINEGHDDKEVADYERDSRLDICSYPSDESRWDDICCVNDTDNTREDTR